MKYKLIPITGDQFHELTHKNKSRQNIIGVHKPPNIKKGESFTLYILKKDFIEKHIIKTRIRGIRRYFIIENNN